MFGQDRTELRRFLVASWQKCTASQPLEPLERLVSGIIAQHPEYHALLTEDDLDRDWAPGQSEINPFLHMGMHITLAEQLGSDRPAGVREMYQALAAKIGDPHAAEHQMMDCLGLVLWEAQRTGRMPDELAFLDCLRKLAL